MGCWAVLGVLPEPRCQHGGQCRPGCRSRQCRGADPAIPPCRSPDPPARPGQAPAGCAGGTREAAEVSVLPSGAEHRSRLSLLCRRERGGAETAAPGTRGCRNRAWMWGIVVVPLPGHPGRCPCQVLGRKEARPPRSPMGPGLLWCPGVTKEPPVTLGVCRERTKPGPGIPAPAWPRPSSLLSFHPYPEAVSVKSPPLLGTHELGLAPGHAVAGSPSRGSIPELGAVPGTKGGCQQLDSQPAMELRCYLCQDTRAACDCLNPITVLKIGIRDKYCELERKEPAV